MIGLAAGILGVSAGVGLGLYFASFLVVGLFMSSKVNEKQYVASIGNPSFSGALPGLTVSCFWFNILAFLDGLGGQL